MKWEFNKIGLFIEAYFFNTEKDERGEKNKKVGIKIILYSLGLLTIIILGILLFIYYMKKF